MSEWRKSSIRDLIEGQWPGEWGSEPVYPLGSARVYRSTELDDDGHLAEVGGVFRTIPAGKLAIKRLLPRDILLEASGGSPERPVGRVGLYLGSEIEPAICANSLRTLRPKSAIDASFLRWRLLLLQRSPAIWRFQQQTTGMINLKVSDYLRHEIEIPNEVHQRRIAEILGTVDEAIEATEALIAKQQQVKAGLMHDLFTRGLTPDGQLRPPRYEAPALHHETQLGWLPKEWEVRNLGSLAEIVSGVTLSSKIEPIGGIEIPYLRVANVQDGYLDLSEIKTVRVSPLQLEKLALQMGDVLMNEGGDFDKLGRGTVWNEEISPCVHQNHVFRVRPRSNRLRSGYLALWSQSACGKKYFLRSSKQSTNLASINSAQLHRFPIALPTIDEQRGIENRISVVTTLLAAESARLAKLRQQKLGLMQALLTPPRM